MTTGASTAGAVPAGVHAQASSSRLANEDLLPVRERTWGTYSYFSLWMSDVHSLGGYVFAAGLFFLGLSGWQILVSMMAGIMAVNFMLNAIGIMGQRTGAPYPVLARLSFGVFGANLPALIRAIVGIFWYGVQTWLASTALVILVEALSPGAGARFGGEWLGLTGLGWICFMTMWGLQQLLFWRGMAWIRKFVDFCGPAVYAVMFVLAAWILGKAGMKAFTLKLSHEELDLGQTLLQMFNVTALVIAYFAALLLNFADFSRFAVSEQAVRRGNFWGLPINFMAFSLVTVIVTAGTMVVFGEALLDPIHVVQRVENKPMLVLGCLTLVVATIGINIVANFVSAAYDIANLAPRYISFARGGFITAVLSIVVLPWKLYHDPMVINLFIGGLGACLGPLFGIIAVDYYLVRKGVVAIEDLYSDSPSGRYWYKRGWNPRAIGAFVPAAIVASLLVLSPWGHLEDAEAYGWLAGTLIGGVLYFVLMSRKS